MIKNRDANSHSNRSRQKSYQPCACQESITKRLRWRLATWGSHPNSSSPGPNRNIKKGNEPNRQKSQSERVGISFAYFGFLMHS